MGKSVILDLINNDPNWEDVLKQKNIRIKMEYPFAIFNYGADVDPLDPIVREARGIIIDLDKKKVACWPFSRFYNSYEECARADLEAFDWDHCRVEEKVDGSIVKLWFNEYDGNWQWSTNSCINAADSQTFSGLSFWELIISAINYHQIEFSALNEDTTYLFELVSPFQQIIVKYAKTALFHIGSRNNVTGEEDWLYIGVPHPRIFSLNTLDDCLKAATELNAGEESVCEEGFVVVDKNWRRLKIKSPEYVAAHRLVANRKVNKEHILDVINEKPDSIDGICRDFPDLAVYFRYYQYKAAELEYDVDRFTKYVLGLYEEYSHDMKAVALTIKDHRLAAFGFEAIKNPSDAKTLIANISKARYLRLIPDYEENKLTT